MSERLTDLTLALHHETPHAVLVSDVAEDARAVWLPRSQIEIAETGKTTAGRLRDGSPVTLPVVEVTLPEWLAAKRGLA